MSLKTRNHKSFESVTQEFQNLDLTKEDKITFANRAPNSSDGGRFWVNYAGSAGSRFYFRHPDSGAWTTV